MKNNILCEIDSEFPVSKVMSKCFDISQFFCDLLKSVNLDLGQSSSTKSLKRDKS
jgi:hypothetical protein